MKRPVRTIAVAAMSILFSLTATSLLRQRSEAQEGVPRLETQLYGQSTWLAGSPASLRVIARDHHSGRPVAGARVTFTLAPAADASGGKAGGQAAAQSPGTGGGRGRATAPARLYTGRTNSLGTVEASFRVPEWQPGSYQLTVSVSGLGEQDRLTRAVTLRVGEQVLLTTDKPLYQPGQTIHIRALALRQAEQRPLADVPTTLEVEDSKGNKVFKKTAKTSAHGIVAADFVLANEVNQGRYLVRALVGDAQQEKTVTVERYVLPKFRVTLTPERKFYQPGQTLAAKVQSDYFFGQPVARGKVVVTLAKFDAGFDEFARIEGQTDETGAFKLEQKLPDLFVGQPLEQGNAFVKYDVAVTDGADHTEKISGTIPVAAQPIKVTVVPESGRVVPNVENIIYILASYPDGSPAKARLTLTQRNTRLADELATDASGIAEWRVTPREPHILLRVVAVDEAGNRAESNVALSGEWQPGSLILRADRALYKVGDTLHLNLLAPEGTGTGYIDLVSGGQTVLTRATPLKGGRGSLAVTLTPEMAGTLLAHAYQIQPDGQIVRDTRVVFVDPGAALKIDVKADRDSYLPGTPAKLTFQVEAVRETAPSTPPKSGGPGGATSSRVFPVALGVSIVDESVFALQEMQPGMEKVYFLLEKEILEPRYEIHAITPGEIVQPALYREAARQRAATVLFAALPRRDLFSLTANSYDEKLQQRMEGWQKEVTAAATAIAAAVKAYRARHNADPDWEHLLRVLAREQLLKAEHQKDPFGRPYRVQYQEPMLIVISDGPDGKPDTGDEIAAWIGPDGRVQPFGGGPGILVRRGGLMFKNELRRGEFGGAMAPEAAIQPAPMPMAADAAAPAGMGGGAGAAPEVRIRQYFPETLFWNPAVITDARGRATLEVPMADSITTWRLTAMGSSPAGLLGSVTAPLRVFQDFFVDIDFPVSLTQNDEVAVPIAVQNWMDESQRVRLVVEREPWFELLEETPEKVLAISSREVRGASFRIRVKEIGFHKLTVKAYGSKMSDAVRREVEVVPDGRRIETSLNDRLEGNVRRAVEIPEGAIPGSANILVKIYPGFLSQVVEGMDKILQMPFGCFEQTSSTTYPNVLALDYMRATNKVTAEIRMKAEQYINLGYQRLLTFEVPGGGFSWFGDAPANKVLTAYGLMEFVDMSAVHPVDPSLIARTRDWLLAQQQPDGSWKPDEAYLHQESWGRIQQSELLPTAYITWALLSGREPNEQPAVPAPVAKAVDYILKNRAAAGEDPYTLGIIANALVAAGRPEANDVLGELLELAKEEDGGLSWESKTSTVTHSHGEVANIEATATIGYALVRSGRFPMQANKVITYLVRSKDPNGTWHSTQATVLALKTLLASQQGAAQGVEADVTVRVNGKEAGKFRITPEDADVMRQVDLKPAVRAGKNEIEIDWSGKGSALYQIAGYHYLPWPKVAAPGGPTDLLSINVEYDRTELEKDAVLTAAVRVAYNRPGAANMVMVDLGIPPGFEVLTEDLNELVGSKVIQRFELTPRQVILYVEKLEQEKPLAFRYRMRAKYPIRAKTAPSTVYQYYNPEIRSTAPPVEVVVQ